MLFLYNIACGTYFRQIHISRILTSLQRDDNFDKNNLCATNKKYPTHLHVSRAN